MSDNLMKYHFEVVGDDFTLAGVASSTVKGVLKQLGVNSSDVRRASIAMYEAEMNMVIHGGGGVIDVTITPQAMKAQFSDNGPGIENIELAMQEGYSTAPDTVRELGFGAGMGLPNIKRSSDILNIISEAGKGTILEIEIHYKSSQ